MAADVETVVVGGGVIGLAIGRALALAGHNVMLLERRHAVGSEISARSSEVIHAGIYYPPGSLRAQLCVQGKELLYRFCRQNGIAHRRVGKLLVATQDSELARLDAIAACAQNNGVTDLQRLSAAQVRAIEPEANCIAACLSPSTGIVDSHALMLALLGHIETEGGMVVLNATVKGVASGNGIFTLHVLSNGVETSTLTARNLVLAAGLGATEIGNQVATWRPGYLPPQTFPARGHYYALTRTSPFRHLIYPMPSGAWLGVHLTLDIAGRARFGPDCEWIDRIDYAFDDPHGERLARFAKEIRRYWPGLPDGALAPDTVGIRPNIYPEGDAAADFAIHGPQQHGIERLIALYGMESPGLTSSLAIGQHVADLLCGGSEQP